MTSTSHVRLPSVAGYFYPADPGKLRTMIGEFFEQVAPPPVMPPPFAFIVPHAGYIYSGFTAAHAYSLLRGHTAATIIILAPSHHESFPEVSIYSGDAYRTPLGDVAIDCAMRTTLLGHKDLFFASEKGHREEHAVEVQLPFLQCALTDFKILPLVIGEQDAEHTIAVGKIVSEAMNAGDAIVLASSDLSHYHSREVAERMDRQTLATIERLDASEFLEGMHWKTVEACGSKAIASVMSCARQKNHASFAVLHYSTSADASGETQHVVGYVSAVFSGERAIH